MVDHVIWDWNGTLLDDGHAVLDALNRLLRELGRAPTDLATYRSLYRRPVRRFYELLLDEPIDDQRWDRIDRGFHEAYAVEVGRVRLHGQARVALGRVAEAGRSQSLLSMAPHDHLVTMVARHDLDHHFDRVDGVRGVGGGHKEHVLRDHLAALGVERTDRVVLIGDALDDAAAAAAVGAHAVLYDGGSHPVEDLRAVGVPVAGSLLEAIDLVDTGATSPVR
ncbi:HAD family hydrolase [Salsipaludibacter albus]|uniref:HAD family hydrolase n=1 Tax=Salsipaludibacter albus TaxID=2849650 RepID=UPI001EE4807C|nr:HAD family hydrolase [Salsipaludibacter albus]MBY5163232.1 HAD hydrolase-like protein [Salsipaludibacter albus]